MPQRTLGAATLAAALLLCTLIIAAPAPSAALGGYLDQFTLVNNLTASSPNGEGNPYGIAMIPRTLGKLKKGNMLITNWNSAAGVNGQGHSIVQMDNTGASTIFATIPNNPPPPGCNGTLGIGGTPINQVGLTMALAVMSNGWVMVGNTPINIAGGVASTGCLIYLDYWGNIVSTLNGGLVRGPWGATVKDNGDTAELFVSMVLGADPTAATPQTGNNGGYVVRYNLNLPKQDDPWSSGGAVPTNYASRIIAAQGFPTAPGVSDTNAGIEGGTVGPAGLVYVPGNGPDSNDLYISDTLGNKIWVVRNASACSGAGTGPGSCVATVLSADNYLANPIGINLIAANGNLLVANGGAGTLLELTPMTSANPGLQVSSRVVDTTGGNGAGILFNAVAGPGPCFKPRVFFHNDGFNTVMVMDP